MANYYDCYIFSLLVSYYDCSFSSSAWIFLSFKCLFADSWSILKRNVIPIYILFGWIKFLLPRIMKEPVGKNSPVGADLETWSWWTHHAPDNIFVSQALDLQTVKAAASSKVVLGIPTYFEFSLITVEAAPP